jgi:hypothetical protein
MADVTQPFQQDLTLWSDVKWGYTGTGSVVHHLALERSFEWMQLPTKGLFLIHHIYWRGEGWPINRSWLWGQSYDKKLGDTSWLDLWSRSSLAVRWATSLTTPNKVCHQIYIDDLICIRTCEQRIGACFSHILNWHEKLSSRWKPLKWSAELRTKKGRLEDV